MSQHHQASRRRTYGRRLHEVHEMRDRVERFDGPLDEIDKVELPWPQARWTASLIRSLDGEWATGRAAH
jgi:hypothetical protein